MNDTWTFNKSLYAFNYWIEFNYIQLQKLKTFLKNPTLMTMEDCKLHSSITEILKYSK